MRREKLNRPRHREYMAGGAHGHGDVNRGPCKKTAVEVRWAWRRRRMRPGARGEGDCLGGPWAGSTWGWAAK
jgi:hypothetical protein